VKLRHITSAGIALVAAGLLTAAQPIAQTPSTTAPTETAQQPGTSTPQQTPGVYPCVPINQAGAPTASNGTTATPENSTNPRGRNARAREGSIIVIDAFNYDAPRTAALVALTARLDVADKKVLILTDGVKQNVFLSGRNLPNVHVMPFTDSSTYHILWSDVVLVEAGAIGQELAPVQETAAPLPKRERATAAERPAATRKAKPAKAAAKAPAKKAAKKSAKKAAKAASAKKSTAKKSTAKKSAAKKSTKRKEK